MRDSQLLHLSRLLLLLEYLMKHLYDAPPALLEQVVWHQIIPHINTNSTKLSSSEADNCSAGQAIPKFPASYGTWNFITVL